MKHFHRHQKFLVLIVSAVLMAGCDSVKTPSKEQVELHLQSQLPLYLKLTETEQKSFPNTQQKGSGRTSVAGQIELTADLYKTSNELLSADIEKAGVPLSIGMMFARQAGPKLQRGAGFIYYVSDRAGKRIPFETEVFYSETANGFNFQGSPNIRLEGKTNDEIQSNPFLLSNSYIHDSSEYLAIINEVQGGWKRFQEKLTQAKRDMDAAFQGSKPLIYRTRGREEVFEENFRLITLAPIEYSEIPNYPFHLNFYAPGEVTWTKGGRLANSDFKAGDVTPVSVSGSIFGGADENKPWATQLVISVPDPYRPGSFYNTGSRLIWNGTEFQWTWLNGSVGATLKNE